MYMYVVRIGHVSKQSWMSWEFPNVEKYEIRGWWRKKILQSTSQQAIRVKSFRMETFQLTLIFTAWRIYDLVIDTLDFLAQFRSSNSFSYARWRRDYEHLYVQWWLLLLLLLEKIEMLLSRYINSSFTRTFTTNIDRIQNNFFKCCFIPAVMTSPPSRFAIRGYEMTSSFLY